MSCHGAVEVAHWMVVVAFSTGVEWGGGGCVTWHLGVWLLSLAVVVVCRQPGLLVVVDT